VARVAVVDAPRFPHEPVPDGFAAAVFGDGAFELVGRRRGSPQEAAGKPALGGDRLLLCWLIRRAGGGRSRTPSKAAPACPGVKRQAGRRAAALDIGGPGRRLSPPGAIL